jgi:CVNH domain
MTSRFRLGVAWIAWLIVAAPATVWAQVPPGSYRQSCSDAQVSGVNLTASCKTRSGASNRTTLRAYPACVGDIWNGDGVLMCTQGPLPPGSYQQSCRDMFVDQRNLNASCKDRSGRFRNALLLDYRNCQGDIWNGDGQLLCNREAPPGGSYAQSCRDIVAEAGNVRATCRRMNGSWQASFLPNYRGCVGDLWNHDGVLECSRAALPTGSYQRSCSFAQTDGHTLTATCKDRSGHDVRTTLSDYAACRNDITNMNGVLHCSKIDLPPGGSYARSCDDIWVDGTTLFARCRRIDGTWVQANLAYKGCTNDIANLNGTLSCTVSSRLGYAQACAAKMGRIPDFDCLTGQVLPITVGGVEQTVPQPSCDKPVILGLSNEGQCVPFARLLELDVGRPDTETVAICRRYHGRDKDSPLFDDIAIVQHDRVSGDTCFFQSPVGSGIDASHMPSPSNDSPEASSKWLEVSAGGHGPGGIDCTRCHDADPFILSPYVQQRAHVEHWDPLGKYQPDPFGVMGVSGFLSVRPKNGSNYDECSLCHRIGVHSWNGIGAQIRESMPPGNTTHGAAWLSQHQQAVDRINRCVADPKGADCEGR